jgi:hypothetical protein
MNVWSPESNKSSKIRADYERIQFKEFDLHKGYVLYIPPYWWYSAQFPENVTDTVVLSATYDSAISIVANSTDLLHHFLQLQRNKDIITRRLVAEPRPKPVEIKEDVDTTKSPNQDATKLEEQPYPSGEPHTASALELAEQLKSQTVVPIRDQHEQVIQHVLG